MLFKILSSLVTALKVKNTKLRHWTWKWTSQTLTLISPITWLGSHLSCCRVSQFVVSCHIGFTFINMQLVIQWQEIKLNWKCIILIKVIWIWQYDFKKCKFFSIWNRCILVNRKMSCLKIFMSCQRQFNTANVSLAKFIWFDSKFD